MKKLVICFMMLLLSVTLVGCSKKLKIEDCMSEITKIYYQAKSDSVNGSICVGQREENYVIDGKHTKTCDFSLITLKFNNQQVENQINVNISVNDVEKQIVLELNPVNHTYMADLGYALGEDDKVSISYKEINLNFVNVSKNFNINHNKAIEIAIDEFGNELNKFYRKGNFEGECYLKVLTFNSNGDEDLFWIFTIVGSDKQAKNIIININDGSINLKN